MTLSRPRVGVVDIGSNSMRLLIAEGASVIGRWVEVTGLGKGVDATGMLSEPAMDRTVAALEKYGRLMDDHGVTRRAAIATSATRDAANRDVFLARATESLGVAPDVIDGGREGRLSFSGATRDLDPGIAWVVSDIGGGSTEFVTAGDARSIDIGSVRLTDRLLTARPATPGQVDAARRHVLALFDDVGTMGSSVVGVAGTWTSLAAIDLGLDSYRGERVEGHRLTLSRLEEITARLSTMTVEETAAIPSLDPARAPVILAGSVVACCVLDVTGAEEALVSEHDSLDGLAAELAALP